MGQKSRPVQEPTERVVKKIRRVTTTVFSVEKKIRIVLGGLRSEDSTGLSPATRRQRPFPKDRTLGCQISDPLVRPARSV